ncbi:MAG: IS982 family transposase [Hymenobacter sp.]|nr:MAG: IS982 family transposase [Hymenobacter sp.]
MREQTVAMYCLLDDIICFTRPANTPPPTSGRRLSDAQVLTTALVATRFFGGNLVVAKHYMEQHWGQNRLDKSGFIRRLHALTDTLHALFALVGDWLKHRHTEARYVLDSFPVAVCHNTRIPRCKLLTGKAYHGRCASKRSWFYGLKVQVVATSAGVPVEFYIHAGGESEQAGRRGLSLDLPAGSVLYTDAGYTDYVAEDLFNEASGSQQQTARRKDSKRPHHPAQNFLLQYFRKRIETTFSQLTARFPKQIHAVTAQGFALKIALFIFAHTLHQAGL